VQLKSESSKEAMAEQNENARKEDDNQLMRERRVDVYLEKNNFFFK
jgi:hypothetical protein